MIFWADLPDKIRIETTSENEGRSESTIEIVNGESTWNRHADGTIEKGPRASRSRRGQEVRSLPTEFQRHFDRGLLRRCFAALTLEFMGTCRVAGYECLKIQAREIPEGQLWPHWLSFNANEFEFAANVERGALLSIKAMVGGEIVETYEVLEATFDGKIDNSLFVYQPEVNERVQAAVPVSERITLEAAAIRAPFTVLRPGYLPSREQTHFDAMYHPQRPGAATESLTIFYERGDSYQSLWVDQRGEGDMEQQHLEWDELLVEGQRMEISDPYPEEGLRVLSCQRENTFVTIISDLPRDELIKIALSLRPVSGH